MKSFYFFKNLCFSIILFSTAASAEGKERTEIPAGFDSIKAIKPAISDTSFKPVRRLWGLAFGDYYYEAHADAGNRGAETNYNGVPSDRNAFQFRRIYLGYNYDIDRKFSVEFLLASEITANTATSGTLRFPMVIIWPIIKWRFILNSLI